MKLVELKEKEFITFAKNHEQANFHQTPNWGNLKTKNGWKPNYVGLKDGNKIIAGALILEKPLLGKNMFYSPRGFLIDYKNKKLLTEFTKQIKEYLKKKNAIFCKIDPYLINKERDIDGNVIKDGIDNEDAINNLKDLGYKHFGYTLRMGETLQPRWMFTLTFNGKNVEQIMSEMDSKTRQLLRKNERCAMRCREIEYDEIKTFKEIMQHTGDRRDFIDRPLSYYQDMWNAMHDDGIFKILFIELHVKEYIEILKQEIEKIEKEKKDRIYKKEKNILKMNEKKFESHNKQDDEAIARNQKKKKEMEELQKKHGDTIILGGISFLIFGNEVLSLNGGTYAEFMHFNSAYNLHWEMVKYAIEKGYKKYNFYGIDGIFDENDPMYGLYLFKRGFGGQVEELIGEFDLVINKPYYFIYKTAFKSYKTIKNILNKIRKKK